MLISALTLAAFLVVDRPAVSPERDAAPQVARATLPRVWALPAQSPGTFTFADRLHAALREIRPAIAELTIPVQGVGPIHLELKAFRAVTLDARVEVGSNKRELSQPSTDALHGLVHFEGAVDGYAHSSCYLAVGTTGVAGWIDLGDSNGHYTMRRVGDETPGLCAGTCEFVRSIGSGAPDVPLCGGALTHGDASEGGVAGYGLIPHGGRRCNNLALDTDFDFYRIFANSPSDSNSGSVAATEYLGTLVGAISVIYRRDCDTSITLGYVRLQQAEADLFNEPDPLGAFRDYWNLNGDGVSRDLFALVTGRRNLPYGGVAWLNAACSDFGYSVDGYMNGRFADSVSTHPGNWDIVVLAHELGHNLGTYHTHDYGIDGCASGTVQRGTIMSYCHTVSGASANIDLRFHRGTAGPIEAFVVSAPCLSIDCDDDGLDDTAEIAANPALDTNHDGLLDACQDCNGNGVVDPVEIALGQAVDVDGDGRLDSCEENCDGIGPPDSALILADPSLDLDGDFVLDSCETDCNGNGIADDNDINTDMTLDRSRDGRIDSCEDCDGDGISDFAELQGSMSRWVGSANDALLRELDPRSGVVRRTVSCGTGPINDLAIGSDGRLYAAADNFIYALDRVSGVAATAWSVALPSQPRSIAVAPNGQLGVLLADGSVRLLAANGTIASILAPAGPPSGTPNDLVFRAFPAGTSDALISFGGGVIRKVSWPGGAGSVFVDQSAAGQSFTGLFAMADGSVLAANATAQGIDRFAADGTARGAWDVENGAMLLTPHSLCSAGDGHAVLATSATSSSTINGYNLSSGYTERAYRVYPDDAPSATAIVIAPASATDLNGDLIPDSCQAVPGDLNGDGVVSAPDLAILLNTWGPCAGCAGDLNGDGAVGAVDLALLLGAWS